MPKRRETFASMSSLTAPVSAECTDQLGGQLKGTSLLGVDLQCRNHQLD